MKAAIESFHETIVCSIGTRSNHSGETQGEYICPNSQTASVDKATYAARLSYDPIYDTATGQSTSQNVNTVSRSSRYTPVQAVNYHMVTGAQGHTYQQSSVVPAMSPHVRNDQYKVAGVQMDRQHQQTTRNPLSAKQEVLGTTVPRHGPNKSNQSAGTCNRKDSSEKKTHNLLRS